MVLVQRSGRVLSLVVVVAALACLVVPRESRAQLTNAAEMAPRLVAFEQDGRALPDRNGEVTLLRAPFTLALAVPTGTTVMARFSRDSRVFDLARSGESLAAPFAAGAGLLEGLRNGDQNVVLTDSDGPGYHAWFYESDDNHPFDAVQIFSRGVLGRRTISRYTAAEGLIAVEMLQARTVYLVLYLVDAAKQELLRASVRLTFVDDPVEVSRNRGPEVVATVGDRVVTLESFRQAYAKASLLATNAPPSPLPGLNEDPENRAVHIQVLERLIDRQIILAEAARLEIAISDDDVMARSRSSQPSTPQSEFMEDVKSSLVTEALERRLGLPNGSEGDHGSAFRAYLDNARSTLGVSFSSALISKVVATSR